MAPIEQKKSLIYFSSGMTQTGMDNRVAIRTVIDRAVRSNVSIYAADTRGLQALGPAGDASQASTRGPVGVLGPRRGGPVRIDGGVAGRAHVARRGHRRARVLRPERLRRRSSIASSPTRRRTTCSGSAARTRSQDGRFRRIRVGVKRPDLKLEYRAGYYAPRDFAHSGTDDREQQLMEQLFSDLSVTDLPVYASSAYFRMKGDRYFVPLWVVVPASKVPVQEVERQGQGDARPARRGARRRSSVRSRASATRSTCRCRRPRRCSGRTCSTRPTSSCRRGCSTLKVVVRENQTGLLGSFEAIISVPDLGRSPIRVSSVIVGSRLQAGDEEGPEEPAPPGRPGADSERGARDHGGPAALPLLRAVRRGFVDRAAGASRGRPRRVPPRRQAARRVRAASPRRPRRSPCGCSRTSCSSAGRSGCSRPSWSRRSSEAAFDRRATTFRLEVPTTDLPPGLYTAQVNVIDDVAGTFAFPRLIVYVKK